jgi:rare lipoprotein A
MVPAASPPLASLRRFLPLLTPILLGALLAGCATHRAPDRTASAKPQAGHGTYKVGNPYQIDGVWYYPAEDMSYDETGIGSWYGEQFHAKETANGEVFDLNSMTAAHRTLPMPSIVEVTNLENGRTIRLRVNDRGPFARGRIIDVSRRAAQLLGFEDKGTAKVRVKILVTQSIQAAAQARGGAPETDTEVAKAAPRDAVVTQALGPPGSAPPPEPLPPIAAAASAAMPPAKGVALAQLGNGGAPPPLLMPSEQVGVVPVAPTQIYVQAGAFSRVENATRVKQRLEALGDVKMSGAKVSGVSLYRVRLGPIATVEEADRLLAKVVESGLPEARIVVD